ncbi:MAG TPA: hypothetical protein VGX37_14055, partial [Allosphingosinicella sp.]|nr:hypothetical protein [Allosphingosinicella sp.]
MASIFPAQPGRAAPIYGRLSDPGLAIGGPRFDALLLWGCPLASALLVWLWIAGAALLPSAPRAAAIAALG